MEGQTEWMYVSTSIALVVKPNDDCSLTDLDAANLFLEGQSQRRSLGLVMIKLNGHSNPSSSWEIAQIYFTISSCSDIVSRLPLLNDIFFTIWDSIGAEPVVSGAIAEACKQNKI